MLPTRLKKVCSIFIRIGVVKKMAFVSLYCLMLFMASCGGNDNVAKNNTADTASNDTATNRRVKTILFFGNSLTAGYGLDDPTEAFPGLIQERLDSLALPYKVINAGLSGETSAGGAGRADWILRQPVDVFVLELGANDGLRGIPVAETKKNLQAIIDKVKAKYPQTRIVLAGMQVPPNMGQTYATAFRKVYPDLASENNVTLIPFILEGVGGELKLNQPDGIHPTAEGHRLLAENVWRVLKDVL